MKKANNKSLISCLFSVLMLTLTLSVINPMTAQAAVKLNKTEASVKVGKTTKLKIKGAKSAKVKWSSSKKKIATVSNKGVVTGKKPGKTTIKAKVSGKTYKCQLSVLCKRHKYVETTVPATAEHGAYKCKKCKVCGHETGKEEIKITEEEAHLKLMQFKSLYPDATPWGMEKTYEFRAGRTTQHGCGAFAAMASDYVFGENASFKMHHNINNIKVGDVITACRGGNAQLLHAFVIVGKNDSKLSVAQANVPTGDDGLIMGVSWTEYLMIDSETTLSAYTANPGSDGRQFTLSNIWTRY
jgi:hypothetical protein